MKKLFYIRVLLFLCISISFSGNSQINNDKIHLIALQKKLIGKKLIFGKWTKKGETETHLTYLGIVKTNQGKTYNIMNSTRIWGLSRRSTNRILIFNGKNQYLGNYPVTVYKDLPTKLTNKVLVFQNTDSQCNKNIASKISLKNGLPKIFFRECNNGYGDIYMFN